MTATAKTTTAPGKGPGTGGGPLASGQSDPGRSDIARGHWVLRLTPASIHPYLELARIDRPIGTWLLLFPCWWSTALASAGLGHLPDLWLMLLFAVGALVMRGAGCTYNDLVDQDIDAKVARTASRPIPSGAVSARQAAAFLVLQLLAGLLVLLQFNSFTIALGAASLLLVFSYPFMKRITWWPQAWLGLTFNWGAWLGWTAVTGTLGWPAALLYLAGIAWTLGYDTIYAHQDREDDALIGVKSSARRLGRATGRWLVVFYGVTLVLMGAAGLAAGMLWPFWIGLAGVAAQFAWQIATLDIDNPRDCMAKFKSNRLVGWSLLLGTAASGALA